VARLIQNMPGGQPKPGLLRPALEAIIDLGHPLVRLAREIGWNFLDGPVRQRLRAGAGHPGLRRDWWPGWV
jgi:transposase, IS5 family